MKSFFHILFITYVFSMPALSATDRGMTLPDVLEAVKTNNPSLSEARRRLALLEAEVEISSAYPNPRVEIQKSIPGDAAFYEVKAIQPVPLTRRVAASKAAARAVLESAGKELEVLENSTLSAARKTWYALRIARERRGFEETNLRFSMDILNKIEMRLQTGEAGNADLARAKVEVARSGYHLQEARTKLNAASGELNGLLGRKPDAPVEISEPGGFSLAPAYPELESLEKYTALALARRVEPQALALREAAADYTVTLEKDKRLPVPELGFIKGSDSAGYSRLYLGLELPFWYNNKGAIAKALAQKNTLGYEGKRLEMDIRLEVYNAWLELDLAQKRLATARETVFMLNDLRRSASQDYLSGKTELAAFYETNRVFLEENVSYLDALNQYYEKTEQMSAVINSGEEK